MIKRTFPSKINNCPVMKLNNGIRIANWSSPHPFTFTTGEVLPACDPDRVKAMSLDIKETVFPGPINIFTNGLYTDIKINTSIPTIVRDDLEVLQDCKSLDIILIPFMVLDAMKKSGIHRGKCRVIRVADRITKEIYPDKFCI